MKELFRSLRDSLRFIDLIDIGMVAFFVYRVLLLIRGTRAMQMLTGLGIIAIIYFLASSFGLFTTHWVLSHFFDYFVLIIIVLFQDDLRRALTNVGKNPFFQNTTMEKDRHLIDELAKAGARLAKDHIGALVVLERETGLKNYIETGAKLDAEVSTELLYSIFLAGSPIHDGAVIISNGRLAGAGCFLPLSKDPMIDKRYGTRHRAAIGITEDSDAIVILVSEEAGECHLVKSGKLMTNLSQSELKDTLASVLGIAPGSLTTLPKRLRAWVKLVRERRKS